MTRRPTRGTVGQVRITCPRHGLLQLGALTPEVAVAFARSHDEGHGDGLHHAVIEWITDPWTADPHDE